MNIRAFVSSDIIQREGIFKDKVNMLNFTVIALALISGTVLYALTDGSYSNEIWDFFKAFSFDFSSKSKVEVFSGIIISHLPYIILMIIFGSSSIGYNFIALISFVKVAGIGMLSTYLYSSFGLKGIEYAVLIFFPGKFIMIFSILFLMHSCINNSLHIRKLTRGEYGTEKSNNIYTVKVASAVLLFLISSFIDCILSVSFSSLFVF